MKIQLNTDKNIQGTEKLEAHVSERINHAFMPFSEQITRVEVHLSDENAQKAGVDDIQCKIEARIQGMQPVLVASKDSSKEKALDQAIQKMKAALDTVIGKMRNR